MPNIQLTSAPMPVAAPTSPASDDDGLDPNWDRFPDSVKARILESLDAGTLRHWLSKRPEWTGALPRKVFDRIARNTIEQHERSLVPNLPPLTDWSFTGLGPSFAEDGFVHAARLIQTCASCRRLSGDENFQVDFVSLPHALDEARVVTQGGEQALLVALPASDETAYGIVSLRGDVRPLPSLRGLRLVRDASPSTFAFIDSRVCAVNGDKSRPLVFRDPATRALHLYDLADDHLQPLPDALRIPAAAAESAHQTLATSSANGRYVAVASQKDGVAKLLVHDRVTDEVVRDAAMGGLSMDVTRVRVDDDGCYAVEMDPAGWDVPPPDAGGAILLRDQAFRPFFLPEGRQVLAVRPASGEIRIMNRDGKEHLASLLHAHLPDTRAPDVRGVAISPGGAMLAATYGDGTCNLYNLIDARAAPIIRSALMLSLPGNAARDAGFLALPWFDTDGGGLNVAYSSGPGESTLMCMRLE